MKFIRAHHKSVKLVFVVVILWAAYRTGALTFALLPDIQDPNYITSFTIRKADHQVLKSLHAQFISGLSTIPGVENVEFALHKNSCEITVKVRRSADLYSTQYLLQEQLNDILISAGLPHYRPVIEKRNRFEMPAMELHLVANSYEAETRMDDWAVNYLQAQLQLCRSVGEIEVIGLEKTFYGMRFRNLSAYNDLIQKLHGLTDWESHMTHGNAAYVFGHNSMPLEDLYAEIRKDTLVLQEGFSSHIRSEFPTGRYYHNGKRTVILRLFLRSGESQFELGQQIQQLLKNVDNKKGYRLIVYQDQVRVLTGKLESIAIALFIALAAVILNILIFTRSMGFSLMVCATVVLTISLSIICLSYLGLELNIISLSGVVIGIGLLVDNPIIIGSEIHHSSTAVDLMKNIGWPLLIANASTVTVFIPFLLMNQLSLEIFAGFVLILALLLISSLVVTFFLYMLYRPGVRHNMKHNETGIRYPRQVFIGSLFILSVCIFFSSVIKHEWLPAYGSQYWEVDEMPASKNNVIAVTEKFENDRKSVEVKYSKKYLSLPYVTVARKKGDPYNVLFGDTEYVWYKPPGNSRLSEGWRQKVMGLVPSFKSTRAFTADYRDYESEPILLGNDKLIAERRVPVRDGVRYGIIPVLRFEQQVHRFDKYGELIRVKLTDREVDSLVNLQARIVNDASLGMAVNQESMWLSFVLILVALLIMLILYFKSLSLSVLVVCAIPVSAIGSITFLHAFNASLNMISITAIIFSTGVGINDAVIKADSLLKNIRRGMDYNQALHAACRMRFTPILLTSITTLFTCLAQIIMTPVTDQIQLSISVALAGGILFSTFWAIFTLPSILKLGGITGWYNR